MEQYRLILAKMPIIWYINSVCSRERRTAACLIGSRDLPAGKCAFSFPGCAQGFFKVRHEINAPGEAGPLLRHGGVASCPAVDAEQGTALLRAP